MFNTEQNIIKHRKNNAKNGLFKTGTPFAIQEP